VNKEDTDAPLGKSLEHTGEALQTALHGDPTGEAVLVAIAVGLVVAGATGLIYAFAGAVRLTVAFFDTIKRLFGRRHSDV
jgi:hypothetical protein